MESDLITTGFDPKQRELCPDGACVGVIGRDGRCKECGAVSPNGPPATVEGDQSPENEADKDATSLPVEGQGALAPSRVAALVEGADFDPEKRQLCADGACLGVIGADGRCKLCGGPPE